MLEMGSPMVEIAVCLVTVRLARSVSEVPVRFVTCDHTSNYLRLLPAKPVISYVLINTCMEISMGELFHSGPS